MYILQTLLKLCNIRYSTRVRYLTVTKQVLDSENHIIKSKSPDIIVPNQLIQEYVWQNLEKWHSKTAVMCFETGKSYTFGEIHKQANALARNLSFVKCGNIVAVILPNVVEFPIVFLGAIQAGLVVSTVNPNYTAAEMGAQLRDSTPKLIFTVKNILTTVRKAMEMIGKNIRIVLIDLKPTDFAPSDCIKLDELCKGDHNTINTNLNPEDVVLLPFSSGTTGLPKGVQLTHKNVVSNLYQMSSPDFIVNLQTGGNFQEVIPVFIPLFHIYGMVGIFLNFFAQGCKLIMIPNLIGLQFMKLLQLYQPTLLFAVPSFIAIILNNPKIKFSDLASVRTIISAAAPLGITAFEKFMEKSQNRIELLQMYGMTETSPLTLMQTVKLPNGAKIGGSGFLIPNTEARIVSLETNKNLGCNKSGELLVRGPQIMKGYYQNDIATSEVITSDGWLKTGDLCYFDETQHFFITDRLKELIKVKGFQVAPAELEEILMSHEEVVDAAVVGIPHFVQGEAPKAFVVLKKNSSLNCDALRNLINSRVVHYKRLVGGVEIVQEIPRNSAGKILRGRLKQM